jgi:hypothetical protein
MRPSPLLLSILAALAACRQDTGCFEVDASVTTCPPASEVDVDDLFLPDACGIDIVGVHGEGTLTDVGVQVGVLRGCCYEVSTIDPTPFSDCMIGRPYREGDGAVVAAIVGGPRDARAAAWARAALGEHASVAAFARLSLQLLAHGAPLDLLRAVHEAAADEVRHADLCLAMARRLGADVEIGPFPFGAPVDAAVALAVLAADAVREGCLAETLGAHVAAVAAALAPDPQVAATLRALADDEARHAALSYRIVAWALAVGGDDVRAAVRAAYARPAPRVDVDELALRAGVDAAVLARAADDGVDAVLRPAGRALLAA